MDRELIDWSNENPKAHRAWKDGHKVFWFTAKNIHSGAQKRVRSYGTTVDDAKDNIGNLDGDWEIL